MRNRFASKLQPTHQKKIRLRHVEVVIKFLKGMQVQPILLLSLIFDNPSVAREENRDESH